jgi:hypothetical protein
MGVYARAVPMNSAKSTGSYYRDEPTGSLPVAVWYISLSSTEHSDSGTWTILASTGKVCHHFKYHK